MKRKYLRVMIPVAAAVAAAAVVLLRALTKPSAKTPESGTGSTAPEFTIAQENGKRCAVFNLLTYNVKNCDNGKKIKEIAEEIAHSGAQIVFLQEIDNGMARSLWKDEAQELAAELGFSYAFFPALCIGKGRYGTAVLSAFPLSGVQMTALPVPKGMETRAVGQADITVEGTPVRLFVTHLSFETREARIPQFKAVNDLLGTAPGNSYLLGGDFNVEDYSEYDALQGAVPAHDANTQAEDIWLIDNIFCDAAKTLRGVRSVPTNNSDHDLVLAEVSIPVD